MQHAFGESHNQTVGRLEARLLWLQLHRGLPKMRSTEADTLTQALRISEEVRVWKKDLGAVSVRENWRAPGYIRRLV